VEIEEIVGILLRDRWLRIEIDTINYVYYVNLWILNIFSFQTGEVIELVEMAARSYERELTDVNTIEEVGGLVNCDFISDAWFWFSLSFFLSLSLCSLRLWYSDSDILHSIYILFIASIKRRTLTQILNCLYGSNSLV